VSTSSWPGWRTPASRHAGTGAAGPRCWPAASVSTWPPHLGHTSKAITECHYIEPDRTVDFRPADVLEATLRPVDPDGALLARPGTDGEDSVLDSIDPDPGEQQADAG
jgi:hypothetical protein